MFNHFMCRNFHHQEDQDNDMETSSSCSTPKRSKGMSISRTKNRRYNPYADRGLDKFSALLANLEDKKQKIYNEMGSDDISSIRFIFSNSNSIKPIIIKLKDKSRTSSSDTDDDKQIIKKNLEFVDKKTIHEVSNIPAKAIEQERKAGSKRRKYFRNFKKPTYYMPLAIMLILVFLAVYGRCFAILCTSIGWYVIPIIKASSRGTTKRKDIKKLSEGPIFPRSVMNEPKDHKLLG